ncbi:MAG: hypothetical protein HGA78_08710, partial [Nitrospirales bacterium]|nr:hypothetical protein [Nitrospirales bacterium]
MEEPLTALKRSERLCSLQVKGLDCAACAEKIEKSLMRHEGVKGVTVSLGAEKVDVRFNPQSTDEKKIASAIRRLGYTVSAGEERTGGKKLQDLLSGERFEVMRIGLVLILILLSIPWVSAFLGVRSLSFSIAAVIIGGYPLIKRAAIELRGLSVTA